ncbi:hypothetical protein BS78_05G019400 [Paspalum vaginatum]|nr:hypothetical protein BS78_05G019400 [Paspalum vaginatum]
MSNRVHPSDAAGAAAADQPDDKHRPAVYTVWKRSSMGFQGTDGFCVYDAAGRLAFRVDNYSRRRKLCAGELLLMDGQGAPLLALRPQLLSLHDRWNCYTAAPDTEQLQKPSSPSAPPQQQQQQVFTMARRSALRTTSDEAEVHMSAPAAGAGRRRAADPAAGYRVEGSFSKRSCKISRAGREAARIARKSAGVASKPVATLGDDVFSLVVRPGVDAATVMAIVVVLDRICHRPCAPSVACSSR